MIIEKSIGGYFELELPKGEEYHQNAIHLNTARNAFEYVLIAKKYKKVYLPYYTCDVMLEVIDKLKINVQFYSIDINFKPIFDFTLLEKQEVFVYTNYFGICDNQVLAISQVCNNLIIDNAQAFYSRPLAGVDTFYSPRKFFGVSDGAYLYTDTTIEDVFEVDSSCMRFSHLLKRIDISAEQGYLDFVANDNALSNNPIRTMSALTSKLLASLDYDQIAFKRKVNFDFLNRFLSSKNNFDFSKFDINVPMVFPYWGSDELRSLLIEHKIYTAKYWPNVVKWSAKDSLEVKLAENLILLPIDQRNELSDMESIIKIVLDYEQNK